MFESCVRLLEVRGVSISDITECVLFLQRKFLPDLSFKEAEDSVMAVLKKREVQHVLITGIELDRRAQGHLLLDKELQRMLESDASLYGVDEVLAYGICNLYGSIALTNFGYIDHEKPGIIGKLNDIHDGSCNTFLDDIVGAIAASAASRLAHQKGENSK